MPLYEYECDANGHRFEKIQKFSDPPIETCPECGSAVRRLVSSPAIQFKGSGWYITDYARAGSGGTKAASKNGDSASSSSSDSSSKSSESTSDTATSKTESAAPAAKSS